MSDDKDNKKTLSVSGRKTLQLKPSAGAAPARGSGGVVVKRKKKLILKPGETAPAETASSASPAAPKKVLKKQAVPSAKKEEPRDPALTESEREARLRALELAQKASEEKARREAEAARKRAILEAAKAQEEKERKAKEQAEAEKTQAAEVTAESGGKTQEETVAPAREEGQADVKAETKTEATARTAAKDEDQKAGTEEKPFGERPEKQKDAASKPAAKEARKGDDDHARPARPAPKKAAEFVERDEVKSRPPHKPVKSRGEPRRRSGKLTVTQALGDGDMETRQRSLASLKRAQAKQKRLAGQQQKQAQKVYREVVVPDFITVQELANRMTEKASDVIKALMKMGVMATINQTIDQDTAELIVEEFGHTVKRVSESDVEMDLQGPEDKEEDMLPRPPVVTVMGHVDHGKTSILDALRKTDVAAGEAGGITQHIGAYQVKLADGARITFLDTPGHAAFSAMRSRGAQVTDIVVLVVAADDGIMPQTIEAISHAKAADVPIIVAINKIDKPEANPDKVRQDLLQHEVFVEKMGGEVLDVEVSAKTGLNLDKLEEAILLQAEILDLKANPNRDAEGIVVEAKLDKGRGPVATVLVKRGTLRVGDVFVAGSEWGRVRALVNERGQQLKEAGPSTPVEILGLQGTPEAGDEMVVVENEAKARDVSEFRSRQKKEKQSAVPKASLEAMFSKLAEKEAASVPVVIKADVQGSVEAISGALENLSTDEVRAHVLHAAVGGISETDVQLAAASSAPILGFNVRASRQAAALAQQEGVEIRYYSVIYDLVDDMKAVMSGLLAPELKEKIIGTAEILEVFSAGKAGKAAGCLVTDGVVRRGAKARLLRDDVVIYEGDLGSLRRFKDDVKEVKAGTECGMNFENYNDLKKGDIIECYEVQEVNREL
ncbi:translation initiation factor IF-2 [Luteithermobacter gelatinilyticus]|uniref:translation initiation factor IF-2 n=1 Tax=Luteithermobacter gelatinilyticus TaxID=2582913 RepID=UPI0011068EDD|nr:translation initiation factor IF-2 [Luteithermobacter gelatinilyticus]